MPRKKKDSEDTEESSDSVIRETDADIEKVEEDVDEDGEKVEHGEVNIGSYKAHLASAQKGINDYHIWFNLTEACIAMAHPNTYHRIDLRDKDMLKRLSKDMDMPIDLEYIDSQTKAHSFLIQANGTFAKNKEPKDPTKDDYGKPITKKAQKANAKREKIQAKLDVLEAKYKKMKDKSGPRGTKLKAKIEELEAKKDRT